MCGIAFIPRASVFPVKYILDVLHRLERKRGGDGNGVWYCSDGWRIVKGKDVNIADIARIANSSRGAVLFHTRRVSKGSDLAKYCHPFRIEWTESDGTRRAGALAHNGTWREYESFIPCLMWDRVVTPIEAWHMSDTAVASMWVSRLGPDFLVSLPSDSGCWVYVEDNSNTAVMHAFGNIVQAKETKWGWIYASEGGLEDPDLEPDDGDSALLAPNGPRPVLGCDDWTKPIKKMVYGGPVAGIGTMPVRLTQGTKTIGVRHNDLGHREGFIKVASRWGAGNVIGGVHDAIIRDYGIIPSDIEEISDLLWQLYEFDEGDCDSGMSLADALNAPDNTFLGALLLGDIDEESMRARATEIMDRVKRIVKKNGWPNIIADKERVAR